MQHSPPSGCSLRCGAVAVIDLPGFDWKVGHAGVLLDGGGLRCLEFLRLQDQVEPVGLGDNPRHGSHRVAGLVGCRRVLCSLLSAFGVLVFAALTPMTPNGSRTATLDVKDDIAATSKAAL